MSNTVARLIALSIVGGVAKSLFSPPRPVTVSEAVDSQIRLAVMEALANVARMAEASNKHS